MADQGKVLIPMTVPASTERGIILSGAGTKSATLMPVGVLYDSTEADQTVGQVQVAGTALVKLAATLAAGDSVKPSATGTAAKATVGTDGTIIGVMLEGGAAGELRSMLIK